MATGCAGLSVEHARAIGAFGRAHPVAGFAELAALFGIVQAVACSWEEAGRGTPLGTSPRRTASLWFPGDPIGPAATSAATTRRVAHGCRRPSGQGRRRDGRPAPPSPSLRSSQQQEAGPADSRNPLRCSRSRARRVVAPVRPGWVSGPAGPVRVSTPAPASATLASAAPAAASAAPASSSSAHVFLLKCLDARSSARPASCVSGERDFPTTRMNAN